MLRCPVNRIHTSWIALAVYCALLIGGASIVTKAQVLGGLDQKTTALTSSSTLPTILRGVGFQQHIGLRIPLDASFTDETGKTAPLITYFGKVPVVLILAYYRCPMLCSQVMSGATSALKKTGLQIGKDFNVLTVSFDPTDTPAAAATTKQTYMEQYGDPMAVAGWHFLSGKEPQIEALTKAVGFTYNYDPKTGMFAHASGIVVVTPDGQLAQYFYGVGFVERDLRLALVQSSQDKLGSLADQVLLFCCSYDPDTGAYHAMVARLLKIGATITIVLIGAGFYFLRRMDFSGRGGASA